MIWQPATFKVAMAGGLREVSGYVFRGLGLHLVIDASPKGRRPASWSLSHLNTGHRIALVKGDVQTVFPIAHEVATCTDWEAFTSLSGWRNTDPELKTKVEAIAARFPASLDRMAGQGSEAMASEIAMERA